MFYSGAGVSYPRAAWDLTDDRFLSALRSCCIHTLLPIQTGVPRTNNRTSEESIHCGGSSLFQSAGSLGCHVVAQASAGLRAMCQAASAVPTTDALVTFRGSLGAISRRLWFRSMPRTKYAPKDVSYTGEQRRFLDIRAVRLSGKTDVFQNNPTPTQRQLQSNALGISLIALVCGRVISGAQASQSC